MSKGAGLEAFGLIVVEHGADEEVLQALMKMEGVTESSLVYGEFDIHCKIEVENLAELTEVITKIRKLKVFTTETLIAYARTKRKSRLTSRHHKKMHHSRARH